MGFFLFFLTANVGCEKNDHRSGMSGKFEPEHESVLFFFYEHMNKINKEVGNDHQATGGESDFNLPEVWAEKTMYIIFWYGSAFTAG